MASGPFSKQNVPVLPPGGKLNGWAGQTTARGTLTNEPASIGASQSQMNLPGDRVILNSADALILSNNNVGNLYCGAYRYVKTAAAPTAACLRARGAFWNPVALDANNASSTLTDMTYEVTPDGNAANYTNTLFAGVFIANTNNNSYSWIQECGKTTVKMIAALTGTGAIGVAVYNPLTPSANNNATDNGAFDVLAGGNSAAIFTANSTTAYTTVGKMDTNFVGVAETAPSNNNTCLINMPMKWMGYRIG